MREQIIKLLVDEERDHSALTIEEMQALLKRQQAFEHACLGEDAGTEETDISDLIFDPESGLLDSSYFYGYAPELLRTHLLVERCFEQFDQINWASLTNGYDEMILRYIEYTYAHPLVWLEELPPDNDSCVIDGRVAVVGVDKERLESEEYLTFLQTMRKKRLVWFAKNLPTSSSVITLEEDKLPPSMPLWYLITTDFTQSDYSPICPIWVRDMLYEELPKDEKKEAMAEGLFSHEALLKNLQFIARECGAESAISLIENLRADWQNINDGCLFGIDLIDKDHKEQFANYLNKGLNLYIGQWRSEEQYKKETIHREQDPDSSFFVITQYKTYEDCRHELIKTLQDAKKKSVACRELEGKDSYFSFKGKSDDKRAALINAWVKYLNITHFKGEFTASDFSKSRSDS